MDKIYKADPDILKTIKYQKNVNYTQCERGCNLLDGHIRKCVPILAKSLAFAYNVHFTRFIFTMLYTVQVNVMYQKTGRQGFLYKN